MSANLDHELLITGAHRPVARAIAEALARDPAVRRVRCVHPLERELPESSPRVRHVAADLRRNRDVRDLMLGEARDVNCIVHVPEFATARKTGRGEPAASVAVAQKLLLAAEEHPRVERFVMLSSADVYRLDSSEAVLIDESHPIELGPEAPASLRERVDADLVACARIGNSRLSIVVLRCSEILVEHGTGQLQDYLSSRVCLRALGYDPMLNLLALEDAAAAVRLAVLSDARGVFNVPGLDSLPLSELIHAAGRIGVALPGPALRPLYALRAVTTAFRFEYAPERRRFHFGAILDGRKAERVLGYKPATHVFLGATPAATTSCR